MDMLTAEELISWADDTIGGHSAATLSDRLGVSRRTVEGWKSRGNIRPVWRWALSCVAADVPPWGPDAGPLQPVSPDDFRAWADLAGFPLGRYGARPQLAAALRLPDRTVKSWDDGTRNIPPEMRWAMAGVLAGLQPWGAEKPQD